MRPTLPLLTLAVLIMTGLAAAQATDPPPLSATNAILYAHTTDTLDAKELQGWLNTLEKDGADTAAGPSGSCTTHTGEKAVDEHILTAAGTAIDRTYTFTLTPAQAATMVLDDAKKIVFNIHFGAGSCFGKVDITSTLTAGTVKLAEGKVTGHWYDNAAAAYPLAKIEAPVTAKEASLESLVWTIKVTGKTGGAGFMGVAKDRGSSGIILPILSVGGAAEPTAFEDITDSLAAEYAFTNATTQTFQYNWTSPGGEFTFGLTGTLDNGSVNVFIASADTVDYNQTLNGTFDESFGLNTEAGPYTIRVDFVKAQGTAQASLEAAAPDALPTDGTGGSATDTTGNGTGGPLENDGKDTPVPVAVALTASLVAAAVVARRRRD